MTRCVFSRICSKFETLVAICLYVYIYTYIYFFKKKYIRQYTNIYIYIQTYIFEIPPRASGTFWKAVEKQVSFWWGLVINLLAKNWRNTHSSSARVGCCQLHLARQGEMENAVANQVSQGLQELIMWSYMVREMETSSFKWLSLWYYFLWQEFQVPKMELLNLIGLFCGWPFLYISLTDSSYR